MATKRKMDTSAVRLLMPKGAEVQHFGTEPEWREQPTPESRPTAMVTAMNWYNYFYDKKQARDFIVQWLERADRKRDLDAFRGVPDSALNTTVAWVCRMNVVGLVLLPEEQARIDTYIKDQTAARRGVVKVVEAAEKEAEPAKPNIQDRLREKVTACGGELEGLLDDFVAAGAKMTPNFRPIDVMRNMNIAPQMVNDIAEVWKQHLLEFETVLAGKDAQLVEGYGRFNKVQMKNFVKFAEQVINDCGAYVQIKKVERKPRKKKPVSPEKLSARFKFLKQFDELKLTGETAVKLVNASEAWLYNVRKRKLIHIVADSHAGSISVKGNSIIGFSPADTVQKTLRKPAEQIKKLLSSGKPAARKVFKEIRATETKFNGRGSEDTLILKAW
jgi:hypothetical protein